VAAAVLTCVWGFAVSVSGAGETSTPVAPSAALWSSVADRHAGDSAPAALPDESLSVAESSAIARAPYTSATTPRMMSTLRRMGVRDRPRADRVAAGVAAEGCHIAAGAM
jgi:hypothetical protein